MQRRRRAKLEPYAALRYLGKPVALLLLDSQEHVVTNPAARMASQGGSVDWFRFWLQGYESSDPEKAAEYLRWEGLCDAQRAQNPDWPTGAIAIGHRIGFRKATH